MGKLSLEKERQRKELEERKRPWAQKYLPQVASLGVAALAVGGFFTNKYLDEKREARELRETYGEIWDYRDELAQKMIGEPIDGKRDFEYFLPKLSRDGEKFNVKVYMGAPPSGTIMNLSPMPADFRKHALQGLEKWNEFFEFSITEDFAQADIKILAENEMFKKFPIAGRALVTNKWIKNSGWSHFAQDEKLLEGTIIYNSVDTDRIRSNPAYFRATIAHEFGHFMGLNHPDVVYFFNIKETSGIKDPTGMDGYLIGEILEKQNALYPQLQQISIMAGSGGYNDLELEIGDLDRRGMGQVLKLYADKYMPNEKIPSKWEELIDETAEKNSGFTR